MTSVLWQIYKTYINKVPPTETKHTKDAKDTGTVPLHLVQAGYQGDERTILTTNASIFRVSIKEDAFAFAYHLIDLYKQCSTLVKIVINLLGVCAFILNIVCFGVYTRLTDEPDYFYSFMTMGICLLVIGIAGLYIALVM